MPALDIARAHYRQRQQLSSAISGEGARLWEEVDPADLSGSWPPASVRLAIALMGAQASVAGQADAYTDAVLAELGIRAEAAGAVVAGSLSGTASDGRHLLRLLFSPVVAVRSSISSGATLGRAMAAGQANLEMILRTQVADAGRVADGIAIAARPRVGYVRMASPPSCPRCAVLAGKTYRYNQGFERHPGCQCIHIPSAENVAGDLRTDPRQLFDEGQIRGLSKADARAISDGADMNRVVNAHRGMYTADGGRKATSALAGRRGYPSTRLRPEQIYRDATSRDDTARLLRLHGYLR